MCDLFRRLSLGASGHVIFSGLGRILRPDVVLNLGADLLHPNYDVVDFKRGQKSEFGQVVDVQNKITVQVVLVDHRSALLHEVHENDLDVEITECRMLVQMIVPEFENRLFAFVHIDEIVNLKQTNNSQRMIRIKLRRVQGK